MIKIKEEDIERIKNGELAHLVVSPEYFRGGDYTHWLEQRRKETRDMSYMEFVSLLIAYMERTYDCLVLYSDGTLYGHRGSFAHVISYAEFDNEDVETFIELAEKFGIGKVYFS